MEIKGKTAEHGMVMKEKMTQASAKAKVAAAKVKPAVKKTPKTSK
jgi:hypothetical protein